jgi:hypothetical protein
MQDSSEIRLVRHDDRNEFGLLQIKRWPASQRPAMYSTQDEAPEVDNRGAMTKWITKRMLPLSGLLALLLGLIVATVGIILYGSGMTTNLLAGSADLLVGVAVAILVVDRINRSNLRRQWMVAYQALHGLLASCYIC